MLVVEDSASKNSVRVGEREEGWEQLEGFIEADFVVDLGMHPRFGKVINENFPEKLRNKAL